MMTTSTCALTHEAEDKSGAIIHIYIYIHTYISLIIFGTQSSHLHNIAEGKIKFLIAFLSIISNSITVKIPQHQDILHSKLSSPYYKGAGYQRKMSSGIRAKVSCICVRGNQKW